MPGRPKPRDLDGDEVLTQYGAASESGTAFRSRPRLDVHPYEHAISLIAGQLSADEAARIVLESFNVWTYTLVHADELAQLEASETLEEFDRILTDLTGGSGVAALAVEGFGVVAWTSVQDLHDRPEIEGVVDYLFAMYDQWQAGLDASAHRVRDELTPA